MRIYSFGSRNVCYYLLISIALLFTTSCIGPKKADKWIAQKYGDSVSLKKSRADYYSLSSPLITSDAKVSRSVKNGTKTLPLFFYWRFDYSMTSTLNPKIAVNLFANAFTTYGNSKQLKEKLKGRSLQLVMEKVPASFTFHDDFRDINLILAQIHWEKIYLVPENLDMVISYTISGAEKKTGTIVLPDNNKLKKNRFFEKMSTAYTEYLNEYEDNIKIMARTVVDKMIAEL